MMPLPIWKILSAPLALLPKIGMGGVVRALDCRVIRKSGQFDASWYETANSDVTSARIDPLLHYVRFGAYEGRDPNPSFESDWYLRTYSDVAQSGRNPFAHYLTIGRFTGYAPNGQAYVERHSRTSMNARTLQLRAEASQETLMGLADANTLAPGERVIPEIDLSIWRATLSSAPEPIVAPPDPIGIFIHLFYPEFAAEIAELLLRFPLDYHAYISTDTAAKAETIKSVFATQGLSDCVSVRIFPNVGWDIAPFIVGFRNEILQHAICLKIHGKKSVHHQAAFGKSWRSYLFSELAGDAARIRYAIGTLAADTGIGILMARHWVGIERSVHNIGLNYADMTHLLEWIGVKLRPGQKVEFPSGSMFWFRNSALEPLLDLKLSWEDFEHYTGREVDGTAAHAIERCILFFSAKAGYRWAFLPPRVDSQ